MSVFAINKILVPVDMSESSLNALDTAVVLAQKHQASLLIVNIEENNWDLLRDDSSSFYTRLNAQDVLTALAGSIQYSNKVQPEVIYEEGNVCDTIIRLSMIQQVDLIVMGTHGASGVRDGFMGSNTYQVIKLSSCPVLSVPRYKKISRFEKALFPIRPVSGALKEYEVLCHFLQAQATLKVLGLSNKMPMSKTGILDKVVDEIETNLKADKITTTTSWGQGDTIADEVLNYALENNPDLVVISSSLDAISKPNFIGPHTQKIINCIKSPLLSIKKATSPSYI